MASRHSRNVNMDEGWEDRWSSQMDGWASLATHAHARNSYVSQMCHSPSASESSFSVSTQDSPSLSAQSEASPIASRYTLQSPYSTQPRFFKIGLFNPDTNHTTLPMKNVVGEFSEMDKIQNWMGLPESDDMQQHASDLHGWMSLPGRDNMQQRASDFHGSEPQSRELEIVVEAEKRHVQSPVHRAWGVSDDGWLSDDSGQWGRTLRQELSSNGLCNSTNGIDASVRCEVSKTQPSNHFYRHREQAGDTSQSVNANQRGDKLTAPASAPPDNMCSTKVEINPRSSEQHAGRLQRESFDKCEGMGAGKRVDGLNVDESCKPLDVDAYCRRDANCSLEGDRVEGDQELHDQERHGHQPCLHGSSNFIVPNLTNSGSSAYIKSMRQLNSRHSAAVEDRYPSSFLHGHFRFVEQDGSPCYIFSLHDSDEVIFGRAWQPESETDKNEKQCLYIFHSVRDEGKTKGGWKSWLKKDRSTSSLVGKMKVFTGRGIRTENRSTKETRFVVYGESSQLPAESAAYQYNYLSNQFESKLLKPASSIKSKYSMPTSSSSSQKFKPIDDRHMSMPSATASQGIITSCLHEPVVRDDMSRHDSWDVHIPCCSTSFTVKQDPPFQQMEIAALLITTTVKECNTTRRKTCESPREARNGAGWGVAFLETGSQKGWGTGFLGKSAAVGGKLEPNVALEKSSRQHQPNAASKYALKSGMDRLRERAEIYAKSSSKKSNGKLTLNIRCSKRKQPKVAVDVVVILPAGHHGLLEQDGHYPPGDGDYGRPTSLLECWQRGGNCECGGWDMGCGLSVLKAEALKLHKKRTTIALTSSDRVNWISPENPLQILTQGSKQKKLLTMEFIQPGHFSLNFQARFSPLQAFATALAIFHEQIA